jgi:toxin ParE1/3/4
LQAVEKTFDRLSEMPLIGSPREIRNPAIEGLRIRPVQGFPDHLIFYIPREDAVEVIRVLHGSQAWLQILEADIGG